LSGKTILPGYGAYCTNLIILLQKAQLSLAWRSQLRSTFYATYGFSFIYDCNFGFWDLGFEKRLWPFAF